MGGTLVPGTWIRIRCGTGVDFAEGTVIAFLGGNGLVGHRIVGAGRDRRGGEFLLTRGDGTPIPDPPIDAERVLGEVIEWQDGDSWRPIPAAPAVTIIENISAAAILLLVRSALVIDVRFAARIAVLLSAIGHRLSPR